MRNGDLPSERFLATRSTARGLRRVCTASLLAALVSSTACSEGGNGDALDASTMHRDAGESDPGRDGSASSSDAGAVLDAGAALDAADAASEDTPDSGASDSGAPDSGALDAGAPDSGAPDAGALDSGAGDSGAGDSGAPDAGTCRPLGWESERVANGGNWGGVPSIAIDPDGVPHILLHRGRSPGTYSSRELSYASRDAVAGRWNLELVIMGTGNDRDDTTDLVIDAHGVPHAVFPGLGNGSGPHHSMLATRGESGWTFAPLGPGNTWASLALDPSGAVHVVNGETTLHYARSSGGALSPIEPRGAARCMSVAAAADGTAHVAYVTTPGAESELHHATRTPAGTWSDVRVDGLGAALDYVCETNVDLGPAGDVHLVYTAATGVRHAERDGDGWSIDELGLGQHISMDVDRVGGVHVSWGGGTTLVYSYLPPGGEWMTETVPGWLGGADTSIAVDATGTVHIASYDESAATGPGSPVYYTTGRVCAP